MRCYSYKTTYQHNLCWHCLTELQDDNNLEMWVQQKKVEQELKELMRPCTPQQKETRLREAIVGLGVMANVSRKEIQGQLKAHRCTTKWPMNYLKENVGPDKYAAYMNPNNGAGNRG